MDQKQFFEPAPLTAPGVSDQYSSLGEFEVRWYDGRPYDKNGDPIYDDD